MPTRNVVLTEHHEELIQRLVSSGRYQNASEVMREGLRLVEERDAERAAKLEALREAARVGIESLESGDVPSFDTDRELKAHLTALTRRALAPRR